VLKALDWESHSPAAVGLSFLSQPSIGAFAMQSTSARYSASQVGKGCSHFDSQSAGLHAALT
jgi:hypothetical protein